METAGRSQALTHQKKGVENVRELIDKLKPQIKLALPRHVDPDRMARVFLTAVQRTPKLFECSRISLAGSLILAAQLGLEPDGLLGQGYLIPFWNRKKNLYECQFMPGYRGLMKLARQSGDISSIYARAVHKKDGFTYRTGLVEVLEHVPYDPETASPTKADAEDQQSPGPLVKVYAVAKFKDGSDPQVEVMTRHEIEAIRMMSQNPNDGPWRTHYDAMALKSVLKKLCRYLPGSVEKDRAIALEERVEAGEPPVFEDIVDMPAGEEDVIAVASPADGPPQTLAEVVQRHTERKTREEV